MATTASTQYPTTSGWLSFAGMLGVVLGVFNAIQGVIALVRSDYFVTPEGQLLLFDYNTWGWFWLIFGGIQILVGIGIMGGATWARFLGVVLAGLAMIGQFAFLSAYPIWSVIVIAFCLVMIYGLIAAPKHAVG